MDYVVLLLAATATAVATGLGAILVILLGRGAEALCPLLLGATVGMMVVASFAGLIRPPSTSAGDDVEVDAPSGS
jgi:zinc transporter ZupT